MTRQEIIELINNNPVLFLATVEGDQPRVRGMMLYKADESGIVFHSGTMKEMEIVDDNVLKDEICEHPTRQFLKAWRESGSLQDFYKSFVVFRLKGGKAATWTMETNFAPKEFIQL